MSFAPQGMVTSAASSSMEGAVVSSIVNVAEVVAKLPEPSVTVNVTLAAPVAAHKSLKAVKSLVQVKGPQASVAVAPPFEANHAFRAATLPEPSHSTVELAAASVITGSTLSSTVTVAVVVVWLFDGSVTVKVTVLSPRSLQSNAVLLKPSVTPQASAEPLSTAAAVVEALPSESN